MCIHIGGCPFSVLKRGHGGHFASKIMNNHRNMEKQNKCTFGFGTEHEMHVGAYVRMQIHMHVRT